MVDIRIFLDKNQIITPGILSGHVYINCKEPIKARKVTLEIYGSANTSWEEREYHYNGGNSNSSTRYIPYYTDIVYLNKRIILWQRRSETERLPAGEMFLNFAFQIDRVLPPSLESLYGHIRYSLKANIDRPHWPDTSKKISFYPSPNFNLNYNPAAFKAIKSSVGKNVGLFCKKEKVDMTVSLSKSGYAIGEEVFFELNVRNGSQRNIYKLKIELVQVVDCSAERHEFTLFGSDRLDVGYRRDKDVMAKFGEKVFVPRSTSSTSAHSFRIPSVTPTFNNGICKIIETSHFLKIKLYVEGTFFDDELIFTCPLIIGTTPINKKTDTSATDSQTNPFGSS